MYNDEVLFLFVIDVQRAVGSVLVTPNLASGVESYHPHLMEHVAPLS